MCSKVSIFATGKMISSGARTEGHARQDLALVAQRLADAHFVPRKTLAVKIENMVGSVDLGNPIRLAEIAANVPHIIYEPEQFPGAIYHPRGPLGISVLLFASGKAVIAGAKDAPQLRFAATELERIAEAYGSEVVTLNKDSAHQQR